MERSRPSGEISARGIFDDHASAAGEADVLTKATIERVWLCEPDDYPTFCGKWPVLWLHSSLNRRFRNHEVDGLTDGVPRLPKFVLKLVSPILIKRVNK